jgi:hypothetical protein
MVAVDWKIGSETGTLAERGADQAGVVEMRLYAADATVEMDMRLRLGSRQARRRFVIKPNPAESEPPEPEIVR